MKNIGLIIVLALIMLLTCCKSNINKTEGPDTVEIFDAFGKKTQVPVSTIADSVEYILLDNSCSQVAIPFYIDVTDSLVILLDYRHIYLFNRFSGRFLREISSFGRGPDEHRGVFYYDETSMAFYGMSPNLIKEKIIFYLNGKKPSRIIVPEMILDNGESWPLFDFAPLKANRFLGYWDNKFGTNRYKLAVFDSTGQILNQYRNYNFFEKKDNLIIRLSNQYGFFRCMDTLRFFEYLTDTIFSVTETEIIPRYFLDMDKLTPPYELRRTSRLPENGNEHTKYIEIEGVRESSRYFLFTFSYDYYSYMGCYDKKKKSTVVCDEKEDKEYYKFPDYYAIRRIGFYNDIDNFVPVGTGRTFYVNSSDKLITYTEAMDVERWFQHNPGKAATLPYRLKKFSEVNAADNFMIQVVHLKK